jgi:hypothetical protein
MANMVLPQPGPPQTMVGRPAGRPPPVISSKPAIPVGAFFSCGKAGDELLLLEALDALRCGEIFDLAMTSRQVRN